jgi:hypothetical protein
MEPMAASTPAMPYTTIKPMLNHSSIPFGLVACPAQSAYSTAMPCRLDGCNMLLSGWLDHLQRASQESHVKGKANLDPEGRRQQKGQWHEPYGADQPVASAIRSAITFARG